jgi:hypothetical protein
MVNVCMLELSGVVPLNSWSVLFELLVHSSSHVDLSRGNIHVFWGREKAK